LFRIVVERLGMEQKPVWIGVREAAEMLGVSHNTLRKLIAEGEVEIVGELGPQRAVALDPGYIAKKAAERKQGAATPVGA
jgi:predicted DNA-binding protein (UPF0251 family)